MPVNSDAVTRAELRRTRLDLIRREYEVNRMICTCTLSARLMRNSCKIFLSHLRKGEYAILGSVQCDRLRLSGKALRSLFLEVRVSIGKYFILKLR